MVQRVEGATVRGCDGTRVRRGDGMRCDGDFSFVPSYLRTVVPFLLHLYKSCSWNSVISLSIYLNRCIMGNFQKLHVWQLAKSLAVKIYKLPKPSKFLKDFGLLDQIQRAAVSIPANIAEGDELGTNRQSIRHFYIAKGSAAELQTLLIISNEIDYISGETLDSLYNECNIISVMLNKLIKARGEE